MLGAVSARRYTGTAACGLVTRRFSKSARTRDSRRSSPSPGTAQLESPLLIHFAPPQAPPRLGKSSFGGSVLARPQPEPADCGGSRRKNGTLLPKRRSEVDRQSRFYRRDFERDDPITSTFINRLANDTAKPIWIDGLLEQHILQALEHAALDDVVLVVVKRGHHQNG